MLTEFVSDPMIQNGGLMLLGGCVKGLIDLATGGSKSQTETIKKLEAKIDLMGGQIYNLNQQIIRLTIENAKLKLKIGRRRPAKEEAED